MRIINPLPILSADDIRQVDAYSIERCKIPGVELMRRAGEAVFEEFRMRFPQKTTYFIVICGLGNNGGDGFAFVLKCWREGYRNFKLYVASEDRMKEPSIDAKYYLQELGSIGISPCVIDGSTALPIENFSVKVDSLFGIGLSRILPPYYREVINSFNALPGFAIAVDCPSGLNNTTGEVEGASVKADLTVTMGYPKIGFFSREGSELVGELAVHDIGLKSYQEVGIKPNHFYFPTEFFIKNPIPPRKRTVHKGDFGKILVLAGSRGFSGAAKMVAISSLRAGAGLVRLFVPFEIYEVVASSLTEVMVDFYLPFGFSECSEGLDKLEPHIIWADVLAVGSGLSERVELQETAYSLINSSLKPVIADAEGTLVMRKWLEDVRATKRLVLLTPHLGELSKLSNLPIEEVKKDPRRVAIGLASSLSCYVLAKSSLTFLATPQGFILYPPQGSPALAKGGSGDILVGALSARTAIALKASDTGHSPYDGDYLTKAYYDKYPSEILSSLTATSMKVKMPAYTEPHLGWIEGIMRGYYLFADASRFSKEFYKDEEKILASEIAEMIDTGRDSD